MKADYVLEKYNLNVDISYEEFNKKYPNCYKSSSIGCSYPMVALDIDNENTLWIDFEYDLSKIRHIERSDEFGRRYEVYQRHGMWSFLK